MRAILLASLLLAAGATTAIAETPVGCIAPERVTAIERVMDPGAVPERVEGAQARGLRDGIMAFTGNAMPEDSTFLLFAVPGAKRVHWVEFRAGCAAIHGHVPAELVRQWRGTAS